MAISGLSEMSALGDRLASPTRRLNFEELAETWLAGRISVRIEGYAALAHDLDLLRRVRGGIGQIFIESASPEAIAGRPCPWSPPCALDALFREQGRLGAHGIPKPYVLGAEPRGRDLVVSMTLFGFAIDWSAAAAHALVATLQHRIDWHALRPQIFLPRPRLVGVTMHAVEGLRLPDERDTVEIQFLTPMNAEGDDPLERPATIIARLARRIQGLALWYDAAIDVDWKGLSAAWETLAYDTGFLRHHRVQRRSGRQMRRYETDAIEGVLRLMEIPPMLRALLTIGREIHVGKGASEGFGRFLLA
jgi:hypothetical protein